MITKKSHESNNDLFLSSLIFARHNWKRKKRVWILSNDFNRFFHNIFCVSIIVGQTVFVNFLARKKEKKRIKQCQTMELLMATYLNPAFDISTVKKIANKSARKSFEWAICHSATTEVMSNHLKWFFIHINESNLKNSMRYFSLPANNEIES